MEGDLGGTIQRELPALQMPAAGRFYEIQQGKGGLLTTAGHAYGVGAGSERLKLAQAINNHPLNRKFWKAPSNAFERQHFRGGIIEFMPYFTCDPLQRRRTKGEKGCFPRIWIPLRERIVFPGLGAGLDYPTHLVDHTLSARAERNIEEETHSTQGEISGRDRDIDDRVSLLRDRRLVPYRFVCAIYTVFSLEGGVSIIFGPATGTLVGPRHVLTAAHVIETEWGERVFRASRIVVVPGAFDAKGGCGPLTAGKGEEMDNSQVVDCFKQSQKPVGIAKNIDVRIPDEWQRDKQHLFDFALIVLDRDVGNRRWGMGRYGHWNDRKHGGHTILSFTKDRLELRGRRVCMSAYSVPRTHGMQASGVNQWRMCGRAGTPTEPTHALVGRSGGLRLGYSMPTEDGMSGAPVWTTFEVQGKTVRKLAAVHSMGGVFGIASTGVLITKGVFDWIRREIVATLRTGGRGK